ncbi:MAG: DUF357 domain-containing protein [Thermoplasmataceae archaeon]
MIDKELEERVKKYIELETEALKKIDISVPENSFLKVYTDDLMNMVRSYFDDAKHFFKKGDYINSLSCLNYSYGWLDSGIRLGVIEGKSDYRLFTMYK